MQEQEIRRAVAEHLGVSPALILDMVRLRDLDADARDLVSLAIRLEKRFGLSIADETLERWSTVGDVVRTARAAQGAALPQT
jgi:acyl carrier protein